VTVEIGLREFDRVAVEQRGVAAWAARRAVEPAARVKIVVA
jgi:hypothetical protein